LHEFAKPRGAHAALAMRGGHGAFAVNQDYSCAADGAMFRD
jgi:hypothetical protein